ncbi:MAG: hypothetical protein J6C63_02170 [Lachnospiraceae bacterium]|nr:hypothetical protein [Lachnospiraceae bacterium]
MIWENIPEKDRIRLQDMLMNDATIKEIDAIFYDLLDEVDDAVKERVEEAYIECGVRFMQLAYTQGLKDAGQK